MSGTGARFAGPRRRLPSQGCEHELELSRLRDQLSAAQSHVRTLEAAQAQLELYAEDLQRTFSELRRQLSNMSALHELSTMIGAVLEPGEVMTRALIGLRGLVAVDAACIYRLEGETARRHPARGAPRQLPPARLMLDDGPVGRMLTNAQPDRELHPEGLLLIPLLASGQVVGVLYLTRRTQPEFAEDEIQLIELVAAEAAAALQNATLYQQTQHLATTDPLTELHNYRHFRGMLDMEIARARRLEYPLGLLVVDADDFKRVNDTHGHPVGDLVLRGIASVLRRSLRRTDVIARYGGEEFIIALPGLGNEGVQAVGEKLRRAVRGMSSPRAPGGEAIRTTISVGGVSAACDQLDAEGMLRLADAALYAAKRQGKDRVHIETGE
ncbi:MAG: sensor domain-containing diguanylate cyclase [Chloroflexota bacterium]